jgi:lipoate-protein ligase A
MTVNEDLLESYLQDRRPLSRIYEPIEIVIVMGAGRKNKNDLKEMCIQNDAIPVCMRRGGGGTVVLSPGMVVLAIVTDVASPFHNREYTMKINGWFVRALEALGVRGIEHRGISDLALRDNKILGASLYRKRLTLFYQASLLVSNDLSLFADYLTMPDRVPAYRGGRSHEEFCTNLSAEGYNICPDEIIEKMTPIVQAELPRLR